MSHLSLVPGPDPAEYFTTVPVCLTCPPGSLGFETTLAAQDCEVVLWHLDPCPQAGEAPTLIRMPGCPTCYTWGDADLSASGLIPGRWAFIPKHGRTPLTSEDGTLATASGGEYCPQMEIDNAVIGHLGQQGGRRGSE